MIGPEYLAGFFDADGYVGVTHQKKWNYFGLRLVFINTDKLFLQLVQSQYGGILQQKQKKKFEHHKIGYHLSFHGEDAKRMSMMLLPYSNIKAAQLKLAMSFPIGRKVGVGEFGAPKVDKESQSEIYNKLKTLKHPEARK